MSLGAGQALAEKTDVLVVNRANRSGEGSNLVSVLQRLGYTVAESTRVPSELSSYKSVWSTVAFEGLTQPEEEALEGYIQRGGRVYLTGSPFECCEAINYSDERIAKAVLNDEDVTVGGYQTTGQIEKFSREAKDEVTQRPHRLTDFYESMMLGWWLGGLRGLDNQNALGYDYAGNPVSAVFDEQDMKTGLGRLVIYMEIDWLLAGFSIIGNRDENEQAKTIENLEDFLKNTPGRDKLDPESAEYVALGDSYAAGVGSFDYIAGTTGKKGCFKAKNGYVEQLAAEKAYTLYFAACNGAKLGNLLEGKDPQISHVSPHTKLVTITIGGNDVGFRSVLESCVDGLYSSGGGKGCATRDEPGEQTALEWLRNGRPPGEYELPHAKKNNISTNKDPLPSLQGLYEMILQRAPEAQLVVVGYPKLFETGREPPNDCQVGTGALGLDKLAIYSSDIEWLNAGDDRLDDLIQDSAEAARDATGRDVRYVDPRAAFIGHGLCDTEESFINALLFTKGVKTKTESMHPTVNGQEVLHQLVLEALDR
jgi:hypothetical protein